jgi:hypothetical protein
MLLGVGLVAWGYVGGGRHPRWLVIALGLAIATAIRPHVAAVVGCCVLAAESLRAGGLLGFRRAVGLLMAAGVAFWTVSTSLDQLGLGEADLEGLQEQFEFRGEKTEQGGSRIEVASGWRAAPTGIVTILMRPFPWEARGIQVLSAAEIWLLWLIVFTRWRVAWVSLKAWRANSFTRFAVPLVLAMALMYGLAFGNLGIIARQRAVILPFLLTLVSGTVLALPASARIRSIPVVRRVQ